MTISQWQIYLMIEDAIECATDSTDALDHAIPLDADTLGSNAIDPVAYMEHDAFASLDSEIASWDR